MAELSDAWWQTRIKWLREGIRKPNCKRLKKKDKDTNYQFYNFLRERGNDRAVNWGGEEKLKDEQQQTLAILKREFPDKIGEIDKIRWFAFGLEEIMLGHCDWLRENGIQKPNGKTNRAFYDYLKNRRSKKQ